MVRDVYCWWGGKLTSSNVNQQLTDNCPIINHYLCLKSTSHSHVLAAFDWWLELLSHPQSLPGWIVAHLQFIDPLHSRKVTHSKKKLKSGSLIRTVCEHLAFSLPPSPSSNLCYFLSLLHCSSYKYAEMKYTLLLVVNDVLWYSLSKPLDSAVFIVYDVFILAFMIMISQRKKKIIQDSPEFFCILIIWDPCETKWNKHEIILLKVKMCTSVPRSWQQLIFTSHFNLFLLLLNTF